MDSALQTISMAAQQSDRWLFLAMLVMNLAAGVFAVKWLVGQWTSLSRDLAAVIQRNSDCIEEIKDTIKNCPRKP